MIGNKYVSYVSDRDFLKCVKWVCDGYPEDVERAEIDFLRETSVDPFKMVFDMVNGEIGTKNWIKNEKMRQADKTVNNRVGDFHQRLLGSVDGWEDLGVGHVTEVDLRKTDNSIFMELKNKYNTMNSSSQSKCRDKLDNISKEFPEATAYWAYIVSKNGSSGEKVWEYTRKGEKFINERVKVIWGKKVYEVVTGNPNALEETWNALPQAINDVIGSEMQINDQDKKILGEFSKHIFG